MDGQWIGYFGGTNSGLAVIDLDDADTHYEGHAFAFDNNPAIPSIVFDISTGNKDQEQSLTTRAIAALHPSFPIVLSNESIRADFPDVILPQEITVNLDATKNKMKIKWETSAGTSGTANLDISRASRLSKYNIRDDIKT